MWKVFLFIGTILLETSAFGQSETGSQILGKWQLYPNVNVGKTLKFVRPESVGSLLDRLSPNICWWFVPPRMVKNYLSYGQSESGIVEEKDKFLPLTSSETWNWKLVENNSILELYKGNQSNITTYQIVKLDADNLWLKEN